MFVDAITIDTTISALMATLHERQSYFKQLVEKYPRQQNSHLWFYQQRIIVPENNDLRRGVISLFHDSTTAGHPGTLRTRLAIEKDFWWPTLKLDVRSYIQGCATCQS